MRREGSIRGRLLLWLWLPLVLFLSVDAWTNYRAATRTVELAFDRMLVTSAHAVADLIRLERGQLVIGLPHAALELYDHASEPGQDEALVRGRMLYRVGFADGSYLAGDRELAAFTGRPASHPIYRSMIALSDTQQGREPLRMAALVQPIETYDGGRLVVVQVAESALPRQALVRSILRETLLRHAVLLAVVLTLVWLVATFALKPLDALARRLEARQAHDLTPLPAMSVPRELRPVVAGFDGLLARLAQAQEQQRRFVADASHQLRTPLSVLQLHADAGLRGDVPERDALGAIAGTLARARGLAEQLLSLARAQQAVQGAPELCDLRAVASEACVELSPLVSAKYLDFHFDALPCEVATYPWMIAEILKNLLRNAIEFTPPHGELGVSLEVAGGRVQLKVWDSGPGLSPAMREHLFQPFSSGHPARGAGLGLAICHDLAQALGAQLLVGNRAGDGLTGVEACLVLRASA